jgi:sulfate permease, SulP family
VIGTLSTLPALVQNAQLDEVVLALITLAILWFTPARIKKVAPPQLIALVLGTLLSLSLLQGDADGLRRIGTIASGFPQLQIPHFALPQLQLMLVNGAVLGMLGCIDALLTAVIADSVTRTEHNSNKELIGQGLGNLMSGLFGGLPGAGATMGTVVNIQSGGRSALSGISAGLDSDGGDPCFHGRWPPRSPRRCSPAIALKVGVDIVDWGFLKRAHRISMNGGVDHVSGDRPHRAGGSDRRRWHRRIHRQHPHHRQDERPAEPRAVKSISTGDGELDISDDEKVLLDQGKGQVLLFQLNGAMLFGVAKAIAREHNAITSCQTVIFDLGEVSHLGVTAALALENAVEEAVEKGRSVYVVGACDVTRRRLEKLKMFELLPSDHTEISRREALERAVASLA